MGFFDIFKKVGGAIQRDVQQSHGGFSNFAAGLAQGVQDKFSGVSPQDRFSMTRQQEEFKAKQEKDEEDRKFRAEQQDAVEEYRLARLMQQDKSLVDRNTNARLSREGTQSRFNQDRAFEVSDNAAELAERIERDTLSNDRKVDAATTAFERSSGEQDEKHAHQLARDDISFSQGRNREIRKEAVTAVGDRDQFSSTEEYLEAVRNAEQNLGLHGTQTPDEGVGSLEDFRSSPTIRLKQEFEDATNEAASPNKDENETAEEEARANAAIAEFEESTFQGRQGGSAGDKFDLFGQPVSDSAEPTLIEQDTDTVTAKAREQSGQLAEFTGLLDKASQGDPETLLQLRRIIENPGAIEQIGVEYGPEFLDTMRKVYEEKMKVSADF